MADTKACAKCGVEKPLDEFCRMAKTRDGKHPWCRECKTEYNRDWRAKNPGYYGEHVKRMRRKHPVHQAARSRIDLDIRNGRRPPARDLACVDCGKQAAHYDHARGYEPPNDGYVEPVCHRCHGLRSRSRGEHQTPHSKRKHAAFPEVSR